MKKRNEKSKQAIEGTVIPATARPPRLATIRDIRREMGRVYVDARTGAINPADATKLTFILATLVNTIRDDDLERRIEQLEEDHEQIKKTY